MWQACPMEILLCQAALCKLTHCNPAAGATGTEAPAEQTLRPYGHTLQKESIAKNYCHCLAENYMFFD